MQEAQQQRLRLAERRAQPSLAPAVLFLLRDCVQPLAGGRCPCCDKRLLPADPGSLPRVPKVGGRMHGRHPG